MKKSSVREDFDRLTRELLDIRPRNTKENQTENTEINAGIEESIA